MHHRPRLLKGGSSSTLGTSSVRELLTVMKDTRTGGPAEGAHLHIVHLADARSSLELIKIISAKDGHVNGQNPMFRGPSMSVQISDYTSDQWGVLNTAEGVGPSSLSEKFSNEVGELQGEKEDIPSQPPVPNTTSVPVATVPLMPEVAVCVFSTISLMLEAKVDIFSALLLEEPLLLSENVRRSDKGKRVINNEGEKAMPKRGMEDEDSVKDSQKAKGGWETHLLETGENTPHP
ncbi:Allantoinase [Forsythia ovata]|uniref:Allantoinase n=1 Tax=Forsythia ovata TaxID=205694 RepID=A0ABD1S157_9LAMI